MKIFLSRSFKQKIKYLKKQSSIYIKKRVKFSIYACFSEMYPSSLMGIYEPKLYDKKIKNRQNFVLTRFLYLSVFFRTIEK